MTAGQFTVGDGVRIHVEIDGSGPALCVFNGAGCTVRQWDGVQDRLTPAHTLIRHDVRGTGASGPGDPAGYTFERYADDLLDVLDHLSVDSFDLWGMAWGARVALVTAARHPDRVRRAALTDLAIDPADPDAQRRDAIAAKEARRQAGIADRPTPNGSHDHRDIDTMRQALAATTLHPDLMPFVGLVSAPVLIATGDHDPNLASSRRALAGFADARLVELPLTGHGSVFHRPELVTDEVLGFLDRV